MERIDNPFSGYGRIVSGRYFIGRQRNISGIKGRVTEPIDPNNLALIGYPRIGKSSIAEHAIKCLEHELMKGNKIPIWINFATFPNSNSFFRDLVLKAYEYLEDNEILDDSLIAFLDKPYRNLLDNENLSWVTLKSDVERFFQKTNKKGFRFIFILDEFDKARDVFKDNYTAFQELRELGYRADFKVTFVTTSRRNIREIELTCSANSVLDLIFKKEYLSMYDFQELQEYYALYEGVGVMLDDSQKERIKYYCGGHPYLLAVLGFEIIEDYMNGKQLDIDVVFHKVQKDFIDYYEQLIFLLKEDQSFMNLLKIIFGPSAGIKSIDIDELAQYGLIYRGEKYYVAYSEHFQGYLKLIEREQRLEGETWQWIQEAEIGLRKVILKLLIDKFPNNWVEAYPNSYAKIPGKKQQIEKLFSRLKESQQRDEELYGGRALNLTLLDHTYIHELFVNFILMSWDDIFFNVFGEGKTYWNDAKGLLEKVRNPFAHSKAGVLLQDWEIKKAEEYCKKIISIVKEQIPLD